MDQTRIDITYLWILDDLGIYGCFIADTAAKLRQFLVSDALPDDVRFVVRHSPEGLSEEEVGEALTLPRRQGVGPSHLITLLGLGPVDSQHSPEDDVQESPEHFDSPLPASGPHLPDEYGKPLAFPDISSLLTESVDELIETLSPRERTILESRLIGVEPALTLEETAGQLGVTRERIRQIENQIIGKYTGCSTKIRHQLALIPRVLGEAQEPIALEELGTWLTPLTGIERWWRLLSRSSEKKLEGRVFLIDLGGRPVLSRIEARRFEEHIRNQREYIQQHVEAGRDVLVEDVWERVWDDLSATQPGLVNSIVELACRDAQILLDDSGQERIVSYGRGANAAVVAVLRNAATPMTYEAVWEALERSYDVRRVHNALQDSAILCGRGTYGLRHHIPYTDEELQEIADVAQELILEDVDPTRQWHARDLTDFVVEVFPEKESGLTVYHVQYALTFASELVSLRRMVWGRRSQYEAGADARRERSALIHSILSEAGRPLTNAEIKDRFGEMRGVGAFFQIFGDEQVVRVGRGLWGLRDRDVPFGEEFIRHARDRVLAELERRQRGLYLDDLASLSGLSDVASDRIVALGSVVTGHDRIAMARGGQVIYLKEWGQPRIRSLREAIRTIFSDGYVELARDHIESRIEHETATHIESFVLSNALSASDACEYDSVRKVWVTAAVSDDSDG